jgi:F0F1-type ATP synthase membrane subunit c/vacuolar-type H+-ATPase subunit K
VCYAHQPLPVELPPHWIAKGTKQEGVLSALGRLDSVALQPLNRLRELAELNNTNMLASAKIIGAGLATIGLAGAGVWIGLVFAVSINFTALNPSLRPQLFSYTISWSKPFG